MSLPLPQCECEPCLTDRAQPVNRHRAHKTALGVVWLKMVGAQLENQMVRKDRRATAMAHYDLAFLEAGSPSLELFSGGASAAIHRADFSRTDFEALPDYQTVDELRDALREAGLIAPAPPRAEPAQPSTAAAAPEAKRGRSPAEGRRPNRQRSPAGGGKGGGSGGGGAGAQTHQRPASCLTFRLMLSCRDPIWRILWQSSSW